MECRRPRTRCTYDSPDLQSVKLHSLLGIISLTYAGPHNLTITKLSEATYGQVSLDALQVAPEGR